MTNLSKPDRSKWTTVIVMVPPYKVWAVSRRFDTPEQAEAAARILRRGGADAKCEPWKPSDFPGAPWRP